MIHCYSVTGNSSCSGWPTTPTTMISFHSIHSRCATYVYTTFTFTGAVLTLSPRSFTLPKFRPPRSPGRAIPFVSFTFVVRPRCILVPFRARFRYTHVISFAIFVSAVYLTTVCYYHVHRSIPRMGDVWVNFTALTSIFSDDRLRSADSGPRGAVTLFRWSLHCGVRYRDFTPPTTVDAFTPGFTFTRWFSLTIPAFWCVLTATLPLTFDFIFYVGCSLIPAVTFLHVFLSADLPILRSVGSHAHTCLDFA